MRMKEQAFGLIAKELQEFLEQNYLGDEPCLDIIESRKAFSICCSIKLDKSEKASIEKDEIIADYGFDMYHDEYRQEKQQPCGLPKPPCTGGLQNSSLEELLGRDADTFSQKLTKLIIRKAVDEVEVYKSSNIDRKLFSKLRRKDYRPSKNTVLALIIGLKLDMEEAKELLSYAGFTFSPCEKTDIIVSFFIESRNYDIDTVNTALFHYGERCLGNSIS